MRSAWIRSIILAAPLLVSRGTSLGSDAVTAAQSAEDFRQIATVLRNPRCINCHTITDFPRQGDDRHPHIMNVKRGPDDHGAVGQKCSACHQTMNQANGGWLPWLWGGKA